MSNRNRTVTIPSRFKPDEASIVTISIGCCNDPHPEMISNGALSCVTNAVTLLRTLRTGTALLRLSVPLYRHESHHRGGRKFGSGRRRFLNFARREQRQQRRWRRQRQRQWWWRRESAWNSSTDAGQIDRSTVQTLGNQSSRWNIFFIFNHQIFLACNTF